MKLAEHRARLSRIFLTFKAAARQSTNVVAAGAGEGTGLHALEDFVALEVCFVAMLGHTVSARAGTPIEFKFQGFYTQTTNTVHPVGGGFSSALVFDPDAVDVEPSALIGVFPYLSWTAPGRFATPYTFANEPVQIANIRVSRQSNVDEQWRVNYTGAGNFSSGILLNFPPGTFATDALPLTLDLSQASIRSFGHTDGGASLLGTITSLTITTVPEPMLGPAIACLAVGSLKRRANFRGTHVDQRH